MKWFKRKKKTTDTRDPSMYVLVRADLSHGLQAAQACHAASYLAAKDPLSLYQHPRTLVLAVADEIELHYYAGLHFKDSSLMEGFLFREPDMGMQATAFACYSLGYEYTGLSLAMKE